MAGFNPFNNKNNKRNMLNKMLVAMAAWEPGRARSGFGAKIGGLGVIEEELPPALVESAARRGTDLTVVTLTPCFAHYDRKKMTKLDVRVAAAVDGAIVRFDVYEMLFPQTVRCPNGDRIVQFRVVYFWNEQLLGWTTPKAIYPDDPVMAAKLYSAMSQAAAEYIRHGEFETVHIHDYHFGLIPFFLGDEFLRRVPVHFTIHNGSYQGAAHAPVGGAALVKNMGIRGDHERLFQRYFEHTGCVNLMKAAVLKTHESGGQITTVSGDWNATWGYAEELGQSEEVIRAKAVAQKGDLPRGVFVPNDNLDVLGVIPVRGITNGLDKANRPETQPLLKAAELRAIQSKAEKPMFAHRVVQEEMLAKDHNFDASRPDVKVELTRLLHLEAFGTEPERNVILFSIVGRLVQQKNLGIVAELIAPILAEVPEAKFVILASATDGDSQGKSDEMAFKRLAVQFPGRVYFNNTFNEPLSKLILAGSHFTLIPSRFEPCGLVDYEASLCGTVCIARNCGGLAKIRQCGYLYEWLDVGDRDGEVHAFKLKILEAVNVFRNQHEFHHQLMLRAMNIDASWDTSAAQYLDLYEGAIWWKKINRALLEFIAQQVGADMTLLAKCQPAQEILHLR